MSLVLNNRAQEVKKIVFIWKHGRKRWRCAHTSQAWIVFSFIGIGRGGGNNPPTFSFNFYVKQEKNHKCTKLKGKIITNVTLIWFEGAGKTTPLNSILEFSIISDFKMRNVLILHWFIKTLWAHDVEMTTMRYNDVTSMPFRRHVMMSCACWEFGPPLPPPPLQCSKPWPPNILNLPMPMSLGVEIWKYIKYFAPGHFDI